MKIRLDRKEILNILSEKIEFRLKEKLDIDIIINPYRINIFEDVNGEFVAEYNLDIQENNNDK